MHRCVLIQDSDKRMYHVNLVEYGACQRNTIRYNMNCKNMHFFYMHLNQFNAGIAILQFKLKNSLSFRYYGPFCFKMNYSEYSYAEIDLKEAHLKRMRQRKA